MKNMLIPTLPPKAEQKPDKAVGLTLIFFLILFVLIGLYALGHKYL